MPTSAKFRAGRHELLLRLARRRGGAIVDRRAYKSAQIPLSMRCSEGHFFRMRPKDLLRGYWCPRCRPLPRQHRFHQLAKALARRHGGKCLAEQYENARALMPWECNEGHRWLASWDNVGKKGSWCPVCAAKASGAKKKQWWRQWRKGSRVKSTARKRLSR